MSDVSLYAIDYTGECLPGLGVCDINAFDVHCFLADYVIRQMNGCPASRLVAVLDSMSSFCGFLAEQGAIDFMDLYEILAVCSNPEPIVARWKAYRELLQERDIHGLEQWRNQVLDCFAI
jgi:hypothetical protein